VFENGSALMALLDFIGHSMRSDDRSLLVLREPRNPRTT